MNVNVEQISLTHWKVSSPGVELGTLVIHANAPPRSYTDDIQSDTIQSLFGVKISEIGQLNR